MEYSSLTEEQKLLATKEAFTELVNAIFDRPSLLKDYISTGAITKKQAKLILLNINLLNSKDCLCCRKFDISKLKLPISAEFEPLISIAQKLAQSKSYHGDIK